MKPMKVVSVKKANKLIEARYQLSLLEQKLILYSATKIDTSAERFTIIKMHINEFMGELGAENQRFTEFKNLAESLMEKQIYIESGVTDRNGNKKFLKLNWLSSLEYKGKGIFELEFSEKLIPYMLRLKDQYTIYNIENILPLQNKYSIRFYEILKQYESIGIKKFEIEELKEIIGCNGYKDYKSFNRGVIKKITGEINEYTDIFINHESVRVGRSIKNIVFSIRKNEKEYNLQELEYISGLTDLSKDEIITLLKMTDKNDILRKYSILLQRQNEEAPIRNRMGFMMKAIKEDYKTDESMESIVEILSIFKERTSFKQLEF